MPKIKLVNPALRPPSSIQQDSVDQSRKQTPRESMDSSEFQFKFAIQPAIDAIQQSLSQRSENAAVAGNKKLRKKLLRGATSEISEQIFQNMPIINELNNFNEKGHIKQEEMTKRLLEKV